MYIKNLELENYRNYTKLSIDFDRKVNIILGNNGQGKTNLIESIYLLSMGKSFKSIKDKEIINFEKDYFRIKSKYNKYDEDIDIEIFVSKLNKKAIKIDDINIKKISQMMDNVVTVIFSPEDLYIIKEDPSKRRNFIDREISQINPIYFNYLYDYKKIINSKNKILKENKIDIELLKIYNEQLSFYCFEIMKYRKNFLIKLDEISNKIHNNITNGKENLKITYSPNIAFENITSKEELNEILNANIKKDIEKRFCYIGCHKDDFRVFINDIDCKKYGSQGQQRTASLSLKLAEIDLIKEDKKVNPILLLDDVMSELDESRQRFLVNSMNNVQIFLTTTQISEEVMKFLPKGKVFNVENGNIK